ncbi:MAG TPA: hypothetical protein VEQ41_07455 [Solirubrobacterales bacterium]|nr:hypothetical protein [Solirubrobacterales bacterium]
MEGYTSRRLVTSVALAALLAVASVAPAATQDRAYVASQCDNAAFKPKMIVLACGDAGLAATKLQWKSWGTSSAAGAGTGRVELCEPSCAEGKVARAPMRIVLSKPRLCPQDGKRHFTRARYTWADTVPTGPKSGTIPLPCSLLED